MRLTKAQLAGALLMPGAYAAAVDAGQVKSDGHTAAFEALILWGSEMRVWAIGEWWLLSSFGVESIVGC